MSQVDHQTLLEPFCALGDPKNYRACDWDLSQDAEAGGYWISFFARHFETILKIAEPAETSRGNGETFLDRAAAARADLNNLLQSFAKNPQSQGRVTMMHIDRWRDESLRRAGIADAFIDLKERENAKMLPLLPIVIAQLDALPVGEQFRAAIEGVFAGNIFDMGAEATAKAFLGNSPDFFTTRKTLPSRPWLIDQFDALADRVASRVHRKLIYFIDNAGSDFLLGALPLIRWFAHRGTHVVIAANRLPTLNDMTFADVNRWWPRVLKIERSFRDLPISIVSTGTGDPMIDLSQVSRELNESARDADLVLLEGMGRGLESNLDAEFDCDAINIAMIKDTMIAKYLGGKIFDLVCQFRSR